MHTWKKTELNYEFLSRFKYLASVRLDEIDSLEQIANLFNRNPYTVHLRLADDAVHVTKNAGKEHKLIYHGYAVFTSESIDKLVHYLRLENRKLPPIYW